MRYDIINIPKTGCTCVHSFLIKYYKPFFRLSDAVNIKKLPYRWPHSVTAMQVDNPVLIIREPMDRFVSCFNYYKYGSEIWSGASIELSVSDFINRKCQNRAYFYDAHFRLQSFYLKPEAYSKTIVMIYNKDMSMVVDKLLHELDVPNQVDINEFPKINISKKRQETNNFTDEELEAINTRYKPDFELYNNVINNPSLFKMVVSA